MTFQSSVKQNDFKNSAVFKYQFSCELTAECASKRNMKIGRSLKMYWY